jgi:glycosyltransferase involved in cell wall biosynthesis
MARVLVVSYYHPPFPGVGGHRWDALAKYLRRAGHDVTVLATSLHGTLPPEAEAGVIRAPDLAQSRLLRALLRRPPLEPTGAGGAPAPDKPPPRLLTRTLVPDPHVVGWAPSALRRALRHLRERGADVLVTSSPPLSVHVLGPVLQRRGVRWVADFRDGWSFEPLEPPFPTAPQRRLDAWLERRLVRRADAVLAATLPIAEDFRARLGVGAVHVPNAWDPELDVQVPDVARPVGDGEVALVHTGKLSGARGRDPAPLLDAIRLLRRTEPELGGRLRLVLAGRIDTEEERLLASIADEGFVVHVGALPRLEAVALQRRADGLVLMTSRDRGEATGKLFEYLAAGRPIVALAEGNEAARIVAETGAGVTVPPDDPEAIAGALRVLATGELEARLRPRGLAAYRYPAPAERVAEVLDRIGVGR